MKISDNYQPKAVLEYFERICAIPHGSGNTKAVSDFCADFARERGLEYYQDDVNNIIIIKEASAGYEDEPALILQGHLDMVCEKDANTEFDFLKDGLNLTVEGDWLKARGTTLGGDDGIAVAMILAALDDDSLPHPRLEALFTVDEETGMGGAIALDVTPLKGKRMLNLDSEEEGVLTVGCAGGLRVDGHIKMNMEELSSPLATITIGGLTGGHSGAEIDKGRASANKLMGRVLHAIEGIASINLADIFGGRADNVITNETTALFAYDKKDEAAIKAQAAKCQDSLRHEYAAADPDIRIELRFDGEKTLRAADAESTHKAITALMCAPFSVQEMCRKPEGLVQTSVNLGVVRLVDDDFKCVFSVRSSLATQKDYIAEQLKLLFEALGGYAVFHDAYPAWEYAENSPLRDKMIRLFTRQYGYEPKVLVIHAGLECGLFSEKIPGLDAVAMGPDLMDIHSPRERLSLPSLQRCWQLVRAIISDR